MKKFNKYNTFKEISKNIGLIVGTGGIIVGFWDKVVGTYFIVLGMWLYLILGE